MHTNTYMSLMCSIFTVVFCVLETLLFSGIFYGFPALSELLQEERFFSNLCSNLSSTTTKSKTNATICAEQRDRLDLVFTVSTVTQSLGTILSGLLVDKGGVRLGKLVSVALFSISSLILAFITPGTAWLLFISIPLLAFSSMITLIANMKTMSGVSLGNLFLVALISGSYDSSAAVFTFLKEMVQRGITTREMYMGIYTAVGVVVILLTTALSTRSRRQERLYGYNDLSTVNQEVTESPLSTIKQMFKSPIYLLLLAWYTIIFLRFVFFEGSHNQMIDLMFYNDEAMVSKYSETFSLVLLFGIFVGLWPGVLYDSQKRCFSPQNSERGSNHIVPLIITSTFCVASSVLVTFFLTKEVLLPSYILILLTRSFLFATANTFLLATFPVERFGFLVGCANLVAGVVSLTQYLLFLWSENDQNVKNPNLLLFYSGILTYLFPLYLIINLRV